MPVMAVEHAATSLLAIVMLVLIAYGSITVGFIWMFNQPLGRFVQKLAVICVIGVLAGSL